MTPKSDLRAHLIGGPHHGQTLDLPAWLAGPITQARDDTSRTGWLAKDRLTLDGAVYTFDHAHPGGERFYVYNAPPDQMED